MTGRRPSGPCPLCELDDRYDAHHPSGRIGSKPIHPRLTYAICPRCNNLMNVVWTLLGIDDEFPGDDKVRQRLALWQDLWGTRPHTDAQARELALAIAGETKIPLAA